MAVLSTVKSIVRRIKTSSGYQKVSQWSLAKDVECSDGKSVEAKLSTIESSTGIYESDEETTVPAAKLNADTLDGNSSSYYAKASDVTQLNNSLTESIEELQSNFQIGVDTIYDAIVKRGVTPTDQSPTECATSIKTMYSPTAYTNYGTSRYNSGYSAGVSAGRSPNMADISATAGTYRNQWVSLSIGSAINLGVVAIINANDGWKATPSNINITSGGVVDLGQTDITYGYNATCKGRLRMFGLYNVPAGATLNMYFDDSAHGIGIRVVRCV